jgi:hypothetical protein
MSEERPSSPTQSSTVPHRTWGFRFSLTDAFALVLFGAAAVGLQRLGSSLWWLVLVVAIHFFLFCNVFRLVRRRELLWAGLFVLNVGFWLLLDHLDWFNVLAVQLPASVGVIAWELKAPRYHGIFADRLNPRLDEYLNGRIL